MADRRIHGSSAAGASRLAPAKHAGAVAMALFAMTVASAARAQVGMMPVGPGGPGALPQSQPMPAGGTAQGGPAPKTHAAAGAETGAQLPTQEPRLPEDPNEIPEEIVDLVGTDASLEWEKGRSAETERSFYGLYYGEKSGDYQLQFGFPFWMERSQPNDRASLFGLSYYQRRSTRVDADVFFPLFWKLRHDQTYTTIVGTIMHSEGPDGHDNWVAPFFFEGTNEGGTGGYFHVPLLLTFTQHSDHDGFDLIGPLFCSWKGGPSCDARTADQIDLGLAPLYFYGRDDRSEYEVIPPLLHYYEYSDVGDASVDVWGPVWMESSRDGGVFNLLPLFWHSWGADEEHTTLVPLFHYGYEGASSVLATPLFVNYESEEGDHTFATYLYARHRGRTELDMVTPLFWQYRDPDISLVRTLLFPFYYGNHSPRSDDHVAFPFYARFHRHHVSDEIWVTPLFRHVTSLTGWETDILPLFFMGTENRSTHFVFAPLVWDFASPKDRSTVVFPIYWRFSDRQSLYQLVGNTYYQEEVAPGGTEWQFHFFPLLSFGETPQGHWWNLLYGLAGYTREGTMAKMRIGYIPFELSE